MTKKEIRAYLERTPENTNWNYLNELLDEFKETEEVESADALQEALTAGGKVALTADLDIDTMLKLTQDTTLDLNEQAITTSAHLSASDNNALLKINGGNVTIKNGVVDAYSNVETWDPATDYNMAVFVHNEDSKVTILMVISKLAMKQFMYIAVKLLSMVELSSHNMMHQDKTRFIL